ncbi:MAG: fasciclin domain-containing protein [Candidatus Melainabacteria bacterium]|nr:fasciclin domain-containing protein [Candidatus Melainabacteria bacterium]
MQLAQSKKVAAVVVAMTLAVISSSQLSADAKKHKRACGKPRVLCSAACNKDLTTLHHALVKTGLLKTLSTKGTYTLFAPSDAAFQKIPKADRDALMADSKRLATVLKYHVLPKKYTASDLSSRRSLVTLEGESVMLNNKDGSQTVDGAIVTKADCDCSNGVVHVIDTVLIPERGK